MYNVQEIRASLSARQRHYLLFCHAFSGCDTVSAIGGHGKTTMFTRLCTGGIGRHMDTFLDSQVRKDAVVSAGIAIFQYIYHSQGATLGATRYNMFLRKAAAGLIKRTRNPPSDRRCTYTAFSSCLPPNTRLDTVEEHVFGSLLLWMGGEKPWLRAYSDSRSDGI